MTAPTCACTSLHSDTAGPVRCDRPATARLVLHRPDWPPTEALETRACGEHAMHIMRFGPLNGFQVVMEPLSPQAAPDANL